MPHIAKLMLENSVNAAKYTVCNIIYSYMYLYDGNNSICKLQEESLAIATL